jgi:hypothetical protein
MIPERNAQSAASESINIQIGIYWGVGWTLEEIASILGLAHSAIRSRTTYHRTRINEVKAWSSAASTAIIAKRIKENEEKADIKARIRTKGYQIIDKTLDQGLQEEQEVYDKRSKEVKKVPVVVNENHLKAADMAIERTEGKALDRKDIVRRDEKVIKHEIDASALLAAVAQMEKLNAMRTTAYLPAAPAAIEAEVIDDPTN